MSGNAVESRSTAHASELWVERTDIRFRDVAPGRVRIEIGVENRGAQRSRPQALRLRAAPFGAFLPWRPLARLEVPALDPGQRTRVVHEARRPRVAPAAAVSDLVPPGLLAGRGASEPGRSTLRAAMQIRRIASMLFATGLRSDLPPDLHELLGRESPHWTGNIDVLVRRRAVERHMAQELRVHPGRANVAVFMLGGDAVSYALRPRGGGAHWPLLLVDGGGSELVREPDGDYRLALDGRGGPRVILFVCRPPADCRLPEAVEIHVQREPQGDEAVVEFTLDPGAAGPGCYAI